MTQLSALFSNRDFTATLQPSADVVPTSLAWSAAGGPDTASIELRSLRVSPWTFSSLLRCPVLVRDDRGRAVWWGFVSAVDFPTGPGYSCLSLDPMVNRVQVNYSAARPGYPDASGLSASIAWQTKSESIAIYGTKESIINLPNTSAAQAAQRQAAELAIHGYPVASLDLSRPAPLGSPVVVHCRGWFSTLAWKYYSNATGLEQYNTFGVGVQTIGNNAAYTKLAQSFYLPASWTAERLTVRVCKVGAPSDNFQIALCADAAGFPGAALDTELIAGSNLTAADYTFREVVLAAPQALAAGVPYWIVLSRSGAIDAANYYSADVDEACGYAAGVLKLWDGAAWQARTVNADLNFRLRGTQETTVQIASIAAAGSAGQFLAGVSIEQPSAVYSSQYRDGTHTGLAEITKLLDSGSSSGRPLLAEVTVDRILRIYSKPDPGSADWTVDSSGQYFDQFGQAAPAYLPPCGRWVRLRGPYTTPAQVSGDPGLTWVDHAAWKPPGE